MQRVSVAHLAPGMITAHNIFSSDGKMLLAAGMVLTEQFIRRIKELEICVVYVSNPLAADVEVPEVLSEQTRVKAVQLMKKSFNSLLAGKKIDVAPLQRVVSQLLDEIVANRDVMLHLTDIRTHDDYTFGHSVNVCMIAALIGTQLGYSQTRLKELALGALLHDIGKMLVPSEILNKPGRLTEDEMDVMCRHSEFGFEILRKQNIILPILSAHVAFQHHERWDGCGYPRKISGGGIHEYARIAAIGDVYDALTADRVYRPGMLPHEAYEIMVASCGTHFDAHLLRLFLDCVAVYPIGTFVQLSNGDVGVVVDVKPGLQTRPVIRLIADKNGRLYDCPQQIDLVKCLNLVVRRVLRPEEALAWQASID